MISKNRLKQIQSLAYKKYRDRGGLFLAEGPKVVEELLAAYPPAYVAATEEWLDAHPLSGVETEVVTPEELRRASLMQTPQHVLALLRKPQGDTDTLPSGNDVSKNLVLALDNIQDPGNLGTIVRICNWFGIGHIVCSPDTADVYAPKVIQATMGALAKVKVHYTPLAGYLPTHPFTAPFSRGVTSTPKRSHPAASSSWATRARAYRPKWPPASTGGCSFPPSPPRQATWRASMWPSPRPLPCRNSVTAFTFSHIRAPAGALPRRPRRQPHPSRKKFHRVVGPTDRPTCRYVTDGYIIHKHTCAIDCAW